VDGIIDLAYQDEQGSVTVVDWKMGAGDGTGDNSLQLAIYALWAIEHFGCQPASLRVCKAHLGSGEVIDFHIDSDVLAAARARVAQDVRRMAAMHVYGEDAIAEAFTPCLQPLVCNQCPFAKLCWGEGELVRC
jgi:hypothetical protein